MVNNIRKYLEYSFFIVINFLLLSPMLIIYNYFSCVLFIKLLSVFFHIYITVPNNTYNFKNIFYIAESEPIIFILTTCFCLTILLIKPFVFHLIYLSKKFPYIKNFLDNFLSQKKYMFNILICSFLIDFICIFIFKDFLAPFLGLLLNYISFLAFFKSNQKNKEISNNEHKIKFAKKFLLVIAILIILLDSVGFLLFLAISITYM